MGSEVEQKENSTETTLKEYFDELFAYALSIGMTYNQFWYEDIDLLRVYHNAEQIRIRKRNQEMWIQGMYIYQAIGSLAPILNGFVKDHKARPYMKKPIPITEDERIEQQNQKVQNFKNYMMKMTKAGKKDG